ncbi:hypothetical protein JX266_008556 [Neoarthrinium moseri]|uniref:uncharacterized protein n=1 Tax=Neoarthrinium moseri TaxID=1658444 RepID=UPI001FDDDB0F|nr:uncharacterized protein JN550_009378 [Neoarthrinium moseri]KAI1845246.1 hypothetical protein JX266_008556 [Neoarthrinium moseri]KAI1863880.1 hypothetical protein JN550_009378 [Neoarthrinium moseri]
MGVWGRGLLQSDNDYDIAGDLNDMLGCTVFMPPKEEAADVLEKLNGGLLSRKLDEILEPSFQASRSWYPRERVFVILAVLAMQIGAKIESRHMTALKVLRATLPNMFQQLQLVTAIEEYKNDGTRWLLGSKGLQDTMFSSMDGEGEDDNGDEFFYSGLGHSVDQDPYPHTWSKRCLSCGESNSELLRCSRCHMARYWDKRCQKHDWQKHKLVCEPVAPRSVSVPDIHSDEFKEFLEQCHGHKE